MNSFIIIGAGMAGLSCGAALSAAGKKVCVLEAEDAVGGRVRSDSVDGFVLDRGFQVLLDAYPAVQELLDLDALELNSFGAGARVYLGKRWTLFPDPARHPTLFLQALGSPVGTLADKLRLLKLRLSSTPGASKGSPWEVEDMTTLAYWQKLGLSSTLIDRFMKPFYRGVFLENELNTSCRMFRFTFGMFASGRACLPAGGMQAVSDQLAARVGAENIRLHCRVTDSTATTVTLENGERLEADAVVWACPPSETSVEWNGVTTLYFHAPEAPFTGPWLALNGSGAGQVNQVVVPTNVAPSYGPPGRHLVSVSINGGPEGSDQELLEQARSECRAWFGAAVDTWEALRVYRIPHAVPRQAVGRTPVEIPRVDAEGRYRCGDVTAHASLQGAMESGLHVARDLLG